MRPHVTRFTDTTARLLAEVTAANSGKRLDVTTLERLSAAARDYSEATEELAAVLRASEERPS